MADDLDETIEESFPASDAPANTPETGIGVNGDHDTDRVESADAPAPAAADERDQYSTKTSSGKQ